MRVPSGTNLYLEFAIAGGTPDSWRMVLAAALESAPVASMLIREDKNMRNDVAVRDLITLAQQRGIAALLLGDAARACDLGADGVHIPWSDEVVKEFKTARGNASLIVGADAGRTRHDAMEIGEGGADYVAFGIPAHVGDRARAMGRQLDLVSWWSELFEVPCVALDVSDADYAHRLAVAGADFIGVTAKGDENPSDAAQRIRIFSEALSVHEGVK
ncbi:thiamine phosphate synthase [Hyphomicrobium sp.]|jgi:thiamine-phosphate pyrophosphorylase|uniref:thiamine phosphate synthase n=1 Tax=Hyphomicrobium sp. TaxID=82 RepID=UPI002BDF59E1|nr:thiamine phosphate synthase [Hyphomicrobium sp.]HVZ04698.1 thiamine phosphate synthase [Hyphomicrobium sp.]